MDTFPSVLSVLLGMLMGVLIAGLVSASYIKDSYREPMDALGIERFQRCEINTTNCHSNWYEIVYKKENK